MFPGRRAELRQQRTLDEYSGDSVKELTELLVRNTTDTEIRRSMIATGTGALLTILGAYAFHQTPEDLDALQSVLGAFIAASAVYTGYSAFVGSMAFKYRDVAEEICGRIAFDYLFSTRDSFER